VQGTTDDGSPGEGVASINYRLTPLIKLVKYLIVVLQSLLLTVILKSENYISLLDLRAI
jgi:hypothetical protein